MAPQPAPSPPRKPGGGRGIGARLTAKVGPLPVWAWAAAILAAYLLYTRMTSSGAVAPSTAGGTADTTSTDANTGGSVTDGGGGFDTSGLEASIGANTDQVAALGSQFDALAFQIQNTPPPDPGSTGAPPGSTSQTGPASTPTPTPTPTSPAATGHLTQSSAGVLQWGGVTFTTKAAFNRWAQQHGTTPTKEFATHPQAKAVYSTLR